MSENENDMFYCSFVSIHYIICECGETFPSEQVLKIHLEEQHPHKKERKEYKCGVCNSIYNTEQECITHYEASHLLPDHDSEPAYNNELEINFENEEVVYEVEVPEITDVQSTVMEAPPRMRHQVRRRRRTNIDKKPTPVKPCKDIICEVCGKQYVSQAALRYHQRVHTGEKPYKCQMCDKAFTMPLFLQIHTRTHTGERPFQCEVCPKAFSNKAALLRHDRVHTGIKPYACQKCGKSFTQSNSLKLHINTVHLKQPAPYRRKQKRAVALSEATELKLAPPTAVTHTELMDANEVLDGYQVVYIKQDLDDCDGDASEILYEDSSACDVVYEGVYDR